MRKAVIWQCMSAVPSLCCGGCPCHGPKYEHISRNGNVGSAQEPHRETAYQRGDNRRLDRRNRQRCAVGIQALEPSVSSDFSKAFSIYQDTPRRGFFSIRARIFTFSPTGNLGIKTAIPWPASYRGDALIDGNIAAKYQDVASGFAGDPPMTPGTLVVLAASQ